MNNEQNYRETEEVSIDERMECHYLPKIINHSIDKNTEGLGEK